MSAIRTRAQDGSVLLLDPFTRLPFVPCPIGSEPSGPVETRKATPDELARLGNPCEPRKEITMRPIRGHLTPAEVQARRLRGAATTAARHQYLAHLTDADVLGAIVAHGSQQAAARALGVGQSSLSRRVQTISRDAA